METGSALGTWIAYVMLVLCLLFMLALVIRTMLLFSTLTIMPASRADRWLLRLIGRGQS